MINKSFKLKVYDSRNIVSFVSKLIIDFENKPIVHGDEKKLKNINNLSLQNLDSPLPILEETVRLINSFIGKLYLQSEIDDYYYFDCSFDLYKKLYDVRLNKFLTDHKNSNELDFLRNEQHQLNDQDRYRLFRADGYDVKYSKYLLQNIDFDIALNRKKEFMNQRIFEINTKKQFNSSIFRSEESQRWFKDSLFELNAFDNNNKPKRGFQAISNALFINTDCKNLIFKYGLSITEFIKYLKNEFNAEIKSSDKLSSCENHEKKVSELIKLHQKVLYQNKPE